MFRCIAKIVLKSNGLLTRMTENASARARANDTVTAADMDFLGLARSVELLDAKRALCKTASPSLGAYEYLDPIYAHRRISTRMSAARR